MKAKRTILAALAALILSPLFAETLVFAPGNNVTTNVAERLAAGLDIQANTGTSGGGIVNLLDSINGPIGTATVKCGTLSVDTLRRANMVNGIANLVLGNGTFRYTGATATTTDMNILLDAAASNDACVVWCDGDLKTTGTFDANNGALIKTGPGTLTLATAARDDWQMLSHSRQGKNYNWIMNMKANGDSPTQAYGNLTIREGRFVIDTPMSVTTVLGCTSNAYDSSSYIMCGSRSGATAPGSEPYGHLDIKGGTVIQRGLILVGYYNGTSVTRPDANSGSSFNIYGGKFTRWGTDQNSINVGFVGTYDDRPGLPSFNVYGGDIDYIMYIRLASNRGSRGKMLVAGSTISGYGLYGAHDNGGTSADDEYIPQAEVHVCSNGVLTTDYIQPCRSGYCDFTIRVTDGGTLRRGQAIVPNANYNTSPMKLVLDGGNLLLWGSNYTIVPDSFKTRLGTKISTINAVNAGTYTLGSEVVPDTDLVPAGSLDGGLRMIGSSSAAIALTGGMAITGPIAVDNKVTVKFGADASTGALVAEGGDVSLAFGWTGSRFATLTASGWDVPGNARITLDGAWTAGTYDLVSLPSDATVNASSFMLKTASDTTDATFATRTEGGRIIVSVTLATRSVASFEWTNPAGGTWGDGANWGDGSGSAPSGTGARASFAAASDAANAAVTLSSGVTIGGITFAATPGYEISGAVLTLDNAGSAAAVTASSGSHSIAAPVVMARETSFNAASGAALEVSGVVSGSSPLQINAAGGTGTVTLSGASTFTGALDVKSGTARVTSIANAGSASPAGAGSTIRVGTATFEFGGASGATDRTFEMAATSSKTKAALAATAGSTLTVNGAVELTSSTIFAKSGEGTVALNGVGGYRFPSGVAVDAGTLAFGSDVFVSQADSVTVASGATLALNSGAALHSRVLTGSGTVLWNGGRWYPSFGTANLHGIASFGASNNSIGSSGAIIDLSDMGDQDLPLGGSWATAGGLSTDGGITITSSRLATDNWLMSASFPATATYGFNGPVTLASGGVAKTTGAALAGNSVAVQANGAIAAAMSGSAAEEATVKNITLADGASIFNYISGAGVCATVRATDSLSVGGTVYVALCTGTGIPNLANTAGTYAILRGPKGTLNASNFAMSPRYKTANGSFALDTSNENYDEVKLTLTSATLFNSQTERDYRRDFVWAAGDGLWREAVNWDCGFAPEDVITSRARVIFPSTVADGTVVTLSGTRIVEVLQTAVPGDLWLSNGTVQPSGSGEYAFIKTTAGTLHFDNILCDEWRSTYMDTSAGATQVVAGVLSNAKRSLITWVNNLVKPGGTLRLEGTSESPFTVYSGTLAGHPDSFGAAYPIKIRNSTLSILSSGEMFATVTGEGDTNANGMNLNIAAGEEVMFVNNVSCTGPFVKTGAGTAYLGGSGTVTLGSAARGNADSAYSTAATEIPANGDLPATGLGVFSLAAGKLVLGLDDRQKVTVNGRLDVGQNIADFDENGNVLDSELEILGGTVTVNGDLNIGRAAGAYRANHDCGEKKRHLTLTMRGGNLTFGSMYMAHDSGKRFNGTTTFNLYGGTVRSTGSYMNLSCETTQTGTEYGFAKSVVNVYGGMFTNTAAAMLGSQYPGGVGNFELNMHGGDFAWTAPFDFYAGRVGASHNMNLHGGVLTTPCLRRREPNSSVNFYFNGGTLRLTMDGASFKEANAAGSSYPSYAWNSIIVSTNGAAFDIPGANTFTLNQGFAHDSALGATRDGGIRKLGTGTLLLSAANTFTGPCVAEAGVMRPTIEAAVSGGVGASGSGVFDMNELDLTVPELVGEGGLVTNGALTVTGRVATESFVKVDDVTFNAATFESNGENYIKVLSSAGGALVVDFGRDETDPLPRDYAVKVAEIPSGSRINVTGINTGRPGRWEITGERRNETDGVVEIWAVLKPLGTTLILR